MMSSLIIGVGYTGARLGEWLVQAGETVLGTRRRETSEECSFPVRTFRLGNPETLPSLVDELPSEDPVRVVFTPGPPLEEGVDSSLEPFRNFVEVLVQTRATHFLYLSSTSVYGDAQGDWVNERTPTEPFSRSGELRVRAEQLARERLEDRMTVVRARIGGIYGPGRSGRERYLDEDYRLVGDGEKWTNRIHVADLVRALAILSRSDESRAVNVTDRRPVRMSELVETIYRLAGRDPDGIRTLSWSEAKSRYTERRYGLLKPQKRVSSQTLRLSVGFEYQYPTIYQGLPPLITPDS